MNMTELPVVEGMIRLCTDGWQQGWHERNGGNVTCRLSKEETEAARQRLTHLPGPWMPLGESLPEVGGMWFLATGSGKYFRNVALDPEDALCLVEINGAGDSYRLRWGLKNGGRPTSELAAHLLNHSVRSKATGGACRVMYHAHPAHIVALTFLEDLTDKAISRALWQSETEAPMVFPGGVGVVDCRVPGSMDLARASAEKMKEYDAVVWAHHGLFTSGPDYDTAFGLMHTVEKAAQVRVLVANAGGAKQQISDKEIRAIAEGCGVQIREAFLEDGPGECGAALESLFEKWCGKLRITPQWDVKLELVRDPAWQKTGDFKIDPDDRKAILMLNVANPRQENMEEVIVHELMHIKMYPLDQVCESLIVSSFEEDTMAYRFAYQTFFENLEVTVEELSKCFLLAGGSDRTFSYGRCADRKSFDELYNGLKPIE